MVNLTTLGKSLLHAKDVEIAALREEIEELKGMLRANGIDPNKTATKNLHPALAAFTPIHEEPAIAAALGPLNAAWDAVDAAADAGSGIDAAADALGPVADAALAAYGETIASRTADPTCISGCQAALEAGNNSFEKVYQVVWDYVQGGEGAAWAKFPAAVDALKAAIPDGTPAKPVQRADGTVALYKDAARAKPKFAAVCAGLEKALACVEGVEVMRAEKLKGPGRLLEKVAFSGAPNKVCDLNRGMVMCNDLAAVNEVLGALAKSDGFTVLRVKDRYTSPSPGGWRDALVNLACVGDDAAHVCELQVVHRSMFVARVGLDGHGVYDRVRNSIELLEKLGMLGTEVNEAGAAWSFDMGSERKVAAKPKLSSASRPKSRTRAPSEKKK